MARADSLNTTPAPAHSTRRGFLSRTAGLAVGATAAVVATKAVASMPAHQACAVSDPILEAIEGHKAAYAILIACLNAHNALEEELPRDKRRSSVICFEERIVETDDPRWIESEREVTRTMGAEADAACDLVSVRPTTRAGLLALLQYALAHETDGQSWPSDLMSDDETKERSWHYFLTENVAAALADIGA